MFILEEFAGGTRISSTTIDPGSRTRITFGRGAVDYKLVGAQVSRIQATLTLNGGEWWIWDGSPEEPSTDGIWSGSDRLTGQSPMRGQIWLHRSSADDYATLTPSGDSQHFDATQSVDLIGEMASSLNSLKSAVDELHQAIAGLQTEHLKQRARDTKQNRAIFGMAIALSLALLLMSGGTVLDQSKRDRLQEALIELVISGLMFGGGILGYRQNEQERQPD